MPNNTSKPVCLTRWSLIVQILCIFEPLLGLLKMTNQAEHHLLNCLFKLN